MKAIKHIPLAFQPQYEHFIEKSVKRRMLVSLMNGKNISLDLNKIPDPDSFFDISMEDRMNIAAIRLYIGRDTVTISRKRDKPKKGEDKYIEGFFYYGSARTGMRSFKTMIEYELLGFCHNAKGDSTEFRYDYRDAMVKIYERNKVVEELNQQIAEAEENDDIDLMVSLEEEVDKILKGKVGFNINREKNSTNAIFVGHAIHSFYDLKGAEILEFLDVNFVLFDSNYREFYKVNIDILDNSFIENPKSFVKASKNPKEAKKTLKELQIVRKERHPDLYNEEVDAFIDKFTKFKEEETPIAFNWESDYHKYRRYVKEREQYHKAIKKEPYRKRKLKEPRKVESPFIPRLPYEGEAPEVLFRIKESGKVDL